MITQLDKKLFLKLTVVALLLSGCSGMQLFQPTPTVTPSPTWTATITPTNTPSVTPSPTITSTPDLFDEYLSMVPDIPSGFTWKILPEKKLAVVIPDGWFYKEEAHPDLKLDGIYVTKENIDEIGRYSTGLTVFIFKDFKDKDEAEEFTINLLVTHKNLETTKEVLKAWDYDAGTSVVHHLRIRGEYPNETENNRNKIVHYSALVANNDVYWSVFESPENVWEQTVKDYGIVLDYIVVFG